MLFHPTAVEIFFFLFLFATPPCSTRPPSSMLLICFDDPHTSTRTGGFWYVFYAIMMMRIKCVFLDSISSLSLHDIDDDDELRANLYNYICTTPEIQLNPNCCTFIPGWLDISPTNIKNRSIISSTDQCLVDIFTIH